MRRGGKSCSIAELKSTTDEIIGPLVLRRHSYPCSRRYIRPSSRCVYIYIYRVASACHIGVCSPLHFCVESPRCRQYLSISSCITRFVLAPMTNLRSPPGLLTARKNDVVVGSVLHTGQDVRAPELAANQTIRPVLLSRGLLSARSDGVVSRTSSRALRPWLLRLRFERILRLGNNCMYPVRSRSIEILVYLMSAPYASSLVPWIGLIVGKLARNSTENSTYSVSHNAVNSKSKQNYSREYHLVVRKAAWFTREPGDSLSDSTTQRCYQPDMMSETSRLCRGQNETGFKSAILR